MSEEEIFRPMNQNDVEEVLQIIRTYDTDDYREAKALFNRDGIDGYHIMAKGQAILGITGAHPIEGTDRAYWLSWTCLSSQYPDSRLDGVDLLKGMISELREMGARIVFVELSDMDHGPEPEQRFGEGIRVYQKAGFTRALDHLNYYAKGESVRILALRLESSHPEPIEADTRVPLLLDADEIAETDDTYLIDWEFDENRESTAADLEKMVGEIRKWRGRSIFIGVAGDARGAIEFFESGGFQEDGRMGSFYQDGVDEVRLRLDI